MRNTIQRVTPPPAQEGGTRAFVYCRVSTQEQATDDHYSLSNQEARCHDYIKQRSWQLVKALRDIGSGKTAERPSYQELLLAIREKRVDVVVVYRLDRLSRNLVDVYDALDAFNRSEVGFASVQESFDTTTAIGRAMLGVAEARRLAEKPLLRESALAAAREELATRDRPVAAERDDLLRRLAEGESAFDKWVERLE